jgi:hypothetical protein
MKATVYALRRSDRRKQVDEAGIIIHGAAPTPRWMHECARYRCAFVGYSVSFCTRQFRISPIQSSFSDGQAIW